MQMQEALAASMEYTATFANDANAAAAAAGSEATAATAADADAVLPVMGVE